ncbi:MAG: nucleotidyltransferase domain-containing protein [Cyanobacterium sp. T60_A2020_053]|nr:nucleotidyltransferase domain-containing protein [Cyanobacterium sp. T60_A2020_053]
MLQSLSMSNTSTQIKAYGRFFRKNNQGEFLNDCDFHNLSSPWYELVKAWQKGCLNLFGSNLISLYLRGSIPRGLAIENCSDLDSIVVVKSSFYQENIDNFYLDIFHQQLQSKFTFAVVSKLKLSPKKIFLILSLVGVLS